MTHFIFHRPELATDLSNRLEGKGLVDASSGLFLAAPRRVGKSTFLKEDLIPDLIRRNWLPVYVDLWANKERDPAFLITDTLKAQLKQHEGHIKRAARAIGLTKISVMGTLTLDLNQPGLPEDITITDVLEELHHRTKKPIVLIIDEAQHALTTPAGLNAMFALKAARDKLNSSAGNRSLMLVFTGSNRDKLANLVLNRTQPFFGSGITTFPLLDRKFTDAFSAWANAALAEGNQLAPEGVFNAFALVGHRPEMLRDLIGQIALSGEAGNLTSLIEKGAQDINSRLWDEFENEFATLTIIQQAVLQVLILKGAPWSPFAEESLAAYRAITGQEAISTATVQTALDGLRDRNLIWRESRGAYTLEDQGLAEWYKHRRPATELPF